MTFIVRSTHVHLYAIVPPRSFGMVFALLALALLELPLGPLRLQQELVLLRAQLHPLQGGGSSYKKHVFRYSSIIGFFVS